MILVLKQLRQEFLDRRAVGAAATFAPQIEVLLVSVIGRESGYHSRLCCDGIFSWGANNSQPLHVRNCQRTGGTSNLARLENEKGKD